MHWSESGKYFADTEVGRYTDIIATFLFGLFPRGDLFAKRSSELFRVECYRRDSTDESDRALYLQILKIMLK